MTFEKQDETEIINKGELVQLGDNNKVIKSNEEMSSMIVGVASEEFVSNNKPTYYYKGVNINQDKQEGLDVIIGGKALVKIIGQVNIGDLLISSEESGKAKAIRYTEDLTNVGKVIGKAIQYTENDDEVIAIINFS